MAYFDKEKNTRVRFSDLSSTYNVSVSDGVRSITPDIAEMLGLYTIIQASKPEYDPDMQGVYENTGGEPTFNDEAKTVSWPWVITERYPAELDDDGNVVKTSEQIKAEQDAERAEAEANAPTQEEIEAEQAQMHFDDTLNAYKQNRNLELRQTDQYALPDWPHADDAARQAWLDYRQALREAFDGLSIDNGNEQVDITNAWETVIATAPDYVAPEAPAEEEEAAE